MMKNNCTVFQMFECSRSNTKVFSSMVMKMFKNFGVIKFGVITYEPQY